MGKQISDLIGDNVRIAWDGVDGTVTGDVHKVDGWEEFNGSNVDEQSGHFFPLTMNSKYSGKSVTFTNRNDGDKTVTIDEDLMVILRIENFKENRITATYGGKTILDLSFAGANLE